MERNNKKRYKCISIIDMASLQQCFDRQTKKSLKQSRAYSAFGWFHEKGIYKPDYYKIIDSLKGNFNDTS